MKRHLFSSVYLWAIFLSFGYFSCSSGNSETPSSTTEDSVTVSSLTTIPNLDLSNVDSASASISTSPLRLAAATVGDDSTAGCEVVQFYKPMVLSRLKSAEALKCYVEKTQEGAEADADTANDVEIPTDAYGYYEVDMGDIEEDAEDDEPGETTVVRVRLGNFVQDGVTTLKMDVCQSGDDDSYSQSLAFEIRGNTENKTWEGHVIEQLPDEGDFSRNNFTFVMNSAAAMEADFNFDEVSTAEAQSYSADNADTETPTDETNYEGLYLLTFAYDSSSERNTVTGSSNNPGENESLIYSIFNTTVGAARSDVSSTDGFEFEDTEAFNPQSDPITVIDSSEVSFFADVESATLPDLIDASEMSEQVSFSDEWDCEAAAGSSIVEVDGTGDTFDYSSCVQLTVESDEMGEADSSACFN